MIFGMPMLPDSGGASLAIGASGAYDQHFVSLAKKLVAAGMGNSILRLGWEFNQAKNPWYAAGQAVNFVAYWKHIVIAMRSARGAHFDFEWNPSVGSQNEDDGAVGNLDDYYPGNAYVDTLGIDVYDSQDNYYPGATAQYRLVENQPWGLNWIAKFAAAHGKLLSIPEFGLGWGPSAVASGPLSRAGPLSGGDDPKFVADVIKWSVEHGVQQLVYWDWGDFYDLGWSQSIDSKSPHPESVLA
jgi:hypothetical protein